jgi:amino acid transporter
MSEKTSATHAVSGSQQADADAATVTAYGYQPVLHRSMGRFSVFAISFSLISISTGLFANYGFGLDQAGPRFVWTWVVVGVGQLIIALNLAHFASRVPLAGYAYQWAAKMLSPKFGWFPGWFALVGWLTGTAGVAYAFAAYFDPYVGLGDKQSTILITTILLLVIYMTIHLFGIKASSQLNNFSVVAELIGITAVGAGLLIYSLVAHLPNATGSFLTSHGTGAAGAGLGALAVSSLAAAYTLTGYEGAADLAEEAQNPLRSVPRAIIMAELISAVVGFIVLLGFTLAIPNLKAAQASSTPLLYVMQAHLPSALTKISMTLIFVAIFACGLINMAAVSRLGFSMARDNMLPFSGSLQKVSTRYGSPFVMLAVATVISVLFTLGAKVEATITSVSSVAIFFAYFLVIFAGMRTEKTSARPEGVFSLGRWAMPAGVLALLWCLVICVALTVPAVGHTAGEGSLVVIALAVIWYFAWVTRVARRGNLGTTGIDPARETDLRG